MAHRPRNPELSILDTTDRFARLFEPVKIGPVTAPNRFYQVPHCTGMGWVRPRTLAEMRGVKAEGGWGGVCVEYAAVSHDSEETPAVSASFWEDADAAALRATVTAVHQHGSLLGLELFHGGTHSPNGQSRTPRIALAVCTAARSISAARSGSSSITRAGIRSVG